MRYSVDRTLEENHEIVTLRDSETRSEACTLPILGNNLFRFLCRGKKIVLEPERISTLFRHDNCYKYGIPILFPPNRISGGRFSYGGHHYHFPLNEPNNYIHGELCKRPWEVISLDASEKIGATSSCRFRFLDHPDILEYFPHELEFETTHNLYQGRMTISCEIRNFGTTDAPMGFGFHPYFSLPSEKAQNVVLQVPSTIEWPVNRDSFVQGRGTPTEFSSDINQGILLAVIDKGDCKVLSLKDEDETHLSLVTQDYEVDMCLGGEFNFVIVFRPSWAQGVSFEPYTCLTDAFNLPWPADVTGARAISAGHSIRFQMSIDIRQG